MNKNKRNGQAALEFMMTYGWVLLVLATMIAGLAYFMPNTKSMTSNKCIFGSAIPCIGTRLTSQNLTIVLRNGMGQGLYNISANVTMPVEMGCDVSSNSIIADQRLTITCTNTGKMNLTKDTRILMLVKYQKTRTGYQQIITGDVYAKYN